MLKDVIEADRAERDQDADCARINAAIGFDEQDIAALRGRQLTPDEMRKKWSAIRDRTILAIRDVRRNIIKRANEAKETETWMIEKLLREKSDGRVLREFSGALQEVPTKGLIDYLSYLIEIGDLARIQCVCMVFKARDDHHQYNTTFDKTLAQFVLAQCGDLGERLVRICRSVGQVDARIADLFCAHDATNRSRAPTSHQLTQVQALTHCNRMEVQP
jgi:hypothetical protein